jgi:hypothetical protein
MQMHTPDSDSFTAREVCAHQIFAIAASIGEMDAGEFVAAAEVHSKPS